MSTLKQVIYASTAEDRFSPTALLSLLTQCRQANPRVGLTGLLVHRDGTFLQLLEGPPKEVDKVMRRIGEDPRHHDIHALFTLEPPARFFPDWSMGFEEVNEVALLTWPGLSHLIQPPQSAAEWADNPDLALAFFTACRDDFQVTRRPIGTPQG